MLRSFSSMPGPAPTWEKLHALTAGTISRQQKGEPVHCWPLAQLEEAGGWEQNYLRVEQYMTTDLFTVQPHEPIDLVALLMVWNNIRHVLVEDEHNRLLGIVSHRRLLRLFGRPIPREEGQLAPVSSIMVTNPVVITPETPSLDAIKLMKERQISCLPVVQEEKLVGVITEDNFLAIAGNLLEQKLASEGGDLDFPTDEAGAGD
jgi:CBS domain-containing protein